MKPDPMQLFAEAEHFATTALERQLIVELRDLVNGHSELKTENAKLKRDLRDYMLAANSEAEFVDELQKENEGLKDRIQSIYGQLNDTEKEVDDLRLLLKQALAALESADWYINQLEQIVYCVDDTGTHEERAKVQSAITAIKERLG
jgi:chromosome segregation ATPase